MVYVGFGRDLSFVFLENDVAMLVEGGVVAKCVDRTWVVSAWVVVAKYVSAAAEMRAWVGVSAAAWQDGHSKVASHVDSTQVGASHWKWEGCSHDSSSVVEAADIDSFDRVWQLGTFAPFVVLHHRRPSEGVH